VFHHSNTRLPAGFERVLAWLLVTPQMHAIHHSIEPQQTHSNFSSGLAIWDRLHGTLRLDRAASDVTIGIAEFREPVAFVEFLELPLSAPLPAVPGPENRRAAGDQGTRIDIGIMTSPQWRRSTASLPSTTGK
jgi:hypothetical protein